jgi:HD superfamily phosphohydrolase
MERSVAEIRDPIHGYIAVTPVEKAVIDSRTFQRLRRVRQLSGAHLTYPGAEHSRFSHSLGVMYLAGKMAEHLLLRGYIDRDDWQKIRLAGLLHDVGHGPFSHTYEEVLDKYQRITHEDIGQWLIEKGELSEILARHSYEASEISKLSVGKAGIKGKNFVNQIVSGQFNADIMDYLVRDSHFAGVEYGNIDTQRLISSIDIVEDRLAMDVAAIYALEAFIIARYEMFKAVYFHRTVRAAEVMIVRAMDYANEQLGLTYFKTPDEFLRLDDSSVLQKLLEIEVKEDRRLKVAREMTENYCDRRLLKAVHEQMLHRRNDFFANILNREDIRLQLASEIGNKVGVDPDYIVIDVPTVASVPYHPTQGRSSDIPVFQLLPSGEKEAHSLSEYSTLIPAMIGFIDVVRVYTTAPNREKVAKAASAVFGTRPYSGRVSM